MIKSIFQFLAYFFSNFPNSDINIWFTVKSEIKGIVLFSSSLWYLKMMQIGRSNEVWWYVQKRSKQYLKRISASFRSQLGFAPSWSSSFLSPKGSVYAVCIQHIVIKHQMEWQVPYRWDKPSKFAEKDYNSRILWPPKPTLLAYETWGIVCAINFCGN